MLNKKMKKNVMIGIGVAVVVVVVLIFSLGGGDSDVSSDGSGSSGGGIVAYSGDADFVDFGAELACAGHDYAEGLKDASEEDAMAKLGEYMEGVELLMNKYGYSAEEANIKSDALVDDLGYAKAVVEKVKVLCPAAAVGLEDNIRNAE